MLAGQWIVNVACYGGFCALGWTVLQYSFVRDFQEPAFLIQGLFCIVLGLSCHLLELLVFEVLSVLDYNLRLKLWRMDIMVMLGILLAILPYYWAHKSTSKFIKGRKFLSSVIACSIVFGFWYLFWRLGGSLPGVISETAASGFLAKLISRVGVLGVWLVAMLSGYGTVWFAYTYLSIFIRPVSQVQVSAMEEQLLRVMHQCLTKKKKIVMAQYELIRDHSSGSRNQKGTMFSSLLSWASSSSATSKSSIAGMKAELEGLEGLSNALLVEVMELKREQERAKESRTVIGCLKNLLGYIMSIYCVIKMVTCMKALVFGEDFTSDPVSRILGFLLMIFSGGSIQINTKALAQYLTLAFIGFISSNSLRAFLRHMQRMFFAVSGFGNATMLVILLTELMGFYVVSSVLLIRQQLPVEHRKIITDAIGSELEFHFFYKWFNALYLASASLTILLFYGQYSSYASQQTNELPLFIPQRHR